MKIKELWNKTSKKYIGTSSYFQLNPTSLALFNIISKKIKKYARGSLLDAGAGDAPYLFLIKPIVKKYFSIDKNSSNRHSTHEGDIYRLPFKNNSFDTILCTQVFEHLDNPQRAISELSRVLKKGGKLIVSVPHLSYLHGEPEDYFRYTPHSLRSIGKIADLSMLSCEAAGGFFTFLFDPFAIFMVSSTEPIPLLNFLIKQIVKIISSTVIIFDQIAKTTTLYPVNLVAIYTKK